MAEDRTAAQDHEYDVPATPTTDEEIAKLPVLDLGEFLSDVGVSPCFAPCGEPACQKLGCVRVYNARHQGDDMTAAYTPPLERIRHSVNQLTDHGSQKCLDCLHHRDEAMDALAQIEATLERFATPARPDGTFNLGRSAVGDMARELLDGAGRYQPAGIPHNRETTRTEEL